MKHRSIDFWREPAGFVALLTLLALLVIPTDVILRGPTLCLSRRLFDMECFGCGMIRAMSFLAHGKIAVAISYHRGVLLAFPALVGFVMWSLWPLRQRLQRRPTAT